MQFIAGLDDKLINFTESLRAPFLTKIFTAVTYLGEWWMVLAVAITVSAVLMYKGKKIQDVILSFATLAGVISAFVLKNLIHRARPANGLVNETSYSFPSAHAVISIVFYGFIIYLLWKRVKNIKLRILIIAMGLIIALAVGFSRLYLGIHYLSDVVGGYLIGFTWLAIGIYVSKKFHVKV